MLHPLEGGPAHLALWAARPDSQGQDKPQRVSLEELGLALGIGGFGPTPESTLMGPALAAHRFACLAEPDSQLESGACQADFLVTDQPGENPSFRQGPGGRAGRPPGSAGARAPTGQGHHFGRAGRPRPVDHGRRGRAARSRPAPGPGHLGGRADPVRTRGRVLRPGPGPGRRAGRTAAGAAQSGLAAHRAGLSSWPGPCSWTGDVDQPESVESESLDRCLASVASLETLALAGGGRSGKPGSRWLRSGSSRPLRCAPEKRGA